MKRVQTLSLVLVLVTSGAIGCAAGNSSFRNLAQDEKAAFHGTQNGYNRLSDHYVAAVDGGRWDSRLMKFYYYPYGNGPKRLIGVTTASLFEDADFGPQNEHFAVSPGGSAMLFFHEAEFGYAEVTQQSDGLYLYVHGEGVTWLRPVGEHVILPTEIDRYLADR
jgi:hypothetical protein